LLRISPGMDNAIINKPGLLMRPEKDEAKAEAKARKCEAEAKNFL